MTEQEKINGWTFEETVKTAENLMEAEQNIFKWDVLRHIRDFAENYKHELEQYLEIGTPEECRAAVEKQKQMKPHPYIAFDGIERNGCPRCFKESGQNEILYAGQKYCSACGQRLGATENEQTD